jgi:hypothetical protein
LDAIDGTGYYWVQFRTLRRAVAKHRNCFEYRPLVNRCLGPLLVRNRFARLRLVSVRHPLGRGSKASGILEIYVDKPKRKSAALGRHSPRNGRVVRRSRVTARNIDVTAT